MKPIHILSIGAAIALSSCANMGTPSGGARDEEPPYLVTATPLQGSVNVTRNKATLTFNEIINLKDAWQKVVTSPTGAAVPKVSALGRKITLEFDSLAPNTTYTVDFADAIEDNNESNPLTGFSYNFSTGPVLDTLRISGRVLSARSLEPQQGIIVGVHSNLSDTAFSSLPLLRVAKTDDRGRFTVRGLAPGKYRIFALDDKDNDFRYSSPEEDVAFHDVTLSPWSETAEALDSVYNPLSGTLDTVLRRTRTRYLPNDILLRTFNSGLRQQYLVKYERLDSTRLFLKFNTPASSLPKTEILGHPEYGKQGIPGILETRAGLDSLVWWLPAPLMRRDSLRVAVTYPRSDQNFNVTEYTDTLDFFTVRPKPVKQKKKGSQKRISRADSIAAVTTVFEVKSPAKQDVHLPVLLETRVPFARLDTSAIHLSVLVDSVYMPIPSSRFSFTADSLSPRRFALSYPWEYGSKYRLETDSLAATDIYGKPTLPLVHDFEAKGRGEYCSLLFHISGLDASPSFVELLDGRDAVLRTVRVEGGDAWFPFLSPGKYYARIVSDTNGNGLYDTGNYGEGVQPELAYYYPKAINIKKNWDKEENWDVWGVPVDMMKPSAVLKNKPATPRNRRNVKSTVSEEEEEEDFDPNRNPFNPNYRPKR